MNGQFKLVKSLTSLSLAATLVTSMITVPADNVDAATTSNFIISKGKLISKSTGEKAKGTVVFNGKVYKDGVLFNGLYKSTFYKSGKKSTGWYGTDVNRKWYENGKLLTGISKDSNKLYIKGKLAVATWYGEGKNRRWYENGKQLTGFNKNTGELYIKGKLAAATWYGEGKNRKWYEKGKALTGPNKNTGELYVNGFLNKGYYLFQNKLYNGPTLNTNVTLFKGELYNGAEINKGLSLFEGILYNGEKRNEGIVNFGRKWYSGAVLATGTIKTPDGKIISVNDGIETTPTPSTSVREHIPTASNVTIKGTEEIGQTLTAQYNYTDIDGDTESGTTIQWYADGVAIAGATNSTFTITEAQQGKIITVKVTPKNAKGTGMTVESTPTPAVDTLPIANNLKITGTEEVGQNLTAQYNYTDVDGDIESGTTIQWYADGVAISGATSKTLTLTAEEVGKQITVKVTPQNAKGSGEEVLSTPTSQISKPDISPIVTNVTITGTEEVGQTLTAQYNYTDIDGDIESGTTFQWYANGVAISGATYSTFTITEAQQGKIITVKVTPKNTKGTGMTVESTPTPAVDTLPTANNLNISGLAQEDQTLTVHYDYTDSNNDQELGTTIQWYADGEPINGATSNTLTLTTAEIGKQITVKVTPRNATGTGAEVTSSATGIVTHVNHIPIVNMPKLPLTIEYQIISNIDLSTLFTDQDHDVLTYQVSNITFRSIALSHHDSMLLMYGDTRGFGTISITADDGKGGTATIFISVSIFDTRPPAFTSVPTITNISTDQFDLNASLSEKGTVYYVAVPSSSPEPSANQIINGTDANGNTTIHGSMDVAENLSGSSTISGLVQGTQYDVYLVAIDINNLQSSVTKVNTSTLATPKLLSNSITNLDFSTTYGTQAQAISKQITNPDILKFQSNPKSFSISDGQTTVPVLLNWDIPTNNGSQDSTVVQVLGSAIDSVIQDYCNANHIPLGERPFGAYGFTDTFYISSFQTGPNIKITLGGSNWNDFFDQNVFEGTNPNYTKNRSFTISDGVNIATIQLSWKFSSITNLVNEINRQLQTANVAVTAVEKGDKFELRANTLQGKIIVDGTNKGEFFSTFSTVE